MWFFLKNDFHTPYEEFSKLKKEQKQNNLNFMKKQQEPVFEKELIDNANLSHGLSRNNEWKTILQLFWKMLDMKDRFCVHCR